MLLVSNLAKKPEWKDVSVWLRLERIYRFFLNPLTNKVDVEQFNFTVFSDNRWNIPIKYPRSVMLYDVEESEQITIDSSPFPILICTSARDFKRNFPAMGKVLLGSIMLIDPMNAEEFSAAAQIFKTVGNSFYRSFVNGENSNELLKADFLSAKPSGRVIFRKLLLQEQINFGEVEFQNIAKANPLNIPSSVNSIVGVTFDFQQSSGVSLETILTNYNMWKLLFLTDECAIRMAELIKSQEHISALENYGLSYQIQQAYVLHGGLISEDKNYNLPDSAKVRNWEWFGSDTSVSIADVEPILKRWPTCSSLCTFAAQYLKKPFYSLPEDKVYTSALVNGVLFDFFTLKRFVYGGDDKYHLHFFQATELKAKGHSFSFKNLFHVLEKLQVCKYTPHEQKTKNKKKVINHDFEFDDRVGSINFYMITSSRKSISEDGIRVTMFGRLIPLTDILDFKLETLYNNIYAYLYKMEVADVEQRLKRETLEVTEKDRAKEIAKCKDLVTDKIYSKETDYLQLKFLLEQKETFKFYVARFPMYKTRSSEIASESA